MRIRTDRRCTRSFAPHADSSGAGREAGAVEPRAGTPALERRYCATEMPAVLMTVAQRSVSFRK
jgi:hypothetical protein